MPLCSVYKAPSNEPMFADPCFIKTVIFKYIIYSQAYHPCNNIPLNDMLGQAKINIYKTYQVELESCDEGYYRKHNATTFATISGILV